MLCLLEYQMIQMVDKDQNPSIPDCYKPLLQSLKI
jgi:hypothetical protein